MPKYLMQANYSSEGLKMVCVTDNTGVAVLITPVRCCTTVPDAFLTKEVGSVL